MTGNSIPTLYCYQFYKKSEEWNYHKVKTGFFWSERLYNPFTQKLCPEAHFESRYGESDTKDDETEKPTSKKALMMVMGKWTRII